MLVEGTREEEVHANTRAAQDAEVGEVLTMDS